MNIQDFIEEEVIRQGFEKDPEKAMRCQWMQNAWNYAMNVAVEHGIMLPSEKDILFMGKLVEPMVNRGGYRQHGVYVGDWVGPRPDALPRLMKKWCDALEGMTPDEAYKEFELIHPFGDGNGRTGKIIHNWLNRSLGDPVLVQDFFGHGVP